MKKIKLNLSQLTNYELLSADEMRKISGGSSFGECYTLLSCELGGTCYSNLSGNNCVCITPENIFVSEWCCTLNEAKTCCFYSPGCF